VFFRLVGLVNRVNMASNITGTGLLLTISSPLIVSFEGQCLLIAATASFAWHLVLPWCNTVLVVLRLTYY
jgi:hypothetical protein